MTSVSRQQIGPTDATCLADGVCVSPDVWTATLALVATLAFAISIAFAVSRLTAATDALQTELERTRRERDALASFVERVANATTANPRLADGGRVQRTGSSNAELSVVVDAYRSTILDLSHYDDEYDDSLFEHMTAELGEDAMLAVRNGAVLSPQLQRTLCARGLEAKRRRDRLLDALDAESDSLALSRRALESITDDLDAVAADVDVDPPDDVDRRTLIDAWQTAEDARRRVERRLEERQREIHAQRDVVGDGDGPFAVYEYVYDALPTDYPVLSAGTTCRKRALDLRKTISQRLHGI